MSDDYMPEDSRSTGTINWVQLDADDPDHFMSPEERLARRHGSPMTD